MSANVAMYTLISRVLRYGRTSQPRGKPIMEMLGEQVRAEMRFPLVTSTARNLGYRFAPAEAAWILTGDNRVDTIRRYSKFIWEFSDDTYFYNGAYGPKVVDQLTYVCDALIEDTSTRQAIIDIWRPNPRSSKDIPCTLSYQFLIREGQLHVVQTMRSSDAWLGYPYDVFNASMLAGYVLLLLRKRANMSYPLGIHFMSMGSSHIYEKDWEKARNYLEDGRELFECPAFDPLAQFGEPQHLIDHLWNLASQSFVNDNDWLVSQLREVAKSKAGINV